MADQGVSEIKGAERWSYTAIEHGHERGPIRVGLVREDGASAEFTVPDFVNDPDDVREVALIVIRALEKWEDVKGLGA